MARGRKPKKSPAADGEDPEARIPFHSEDGVYQSSFTDLDAARIPMSPMIMPGDGFRVEQGIVEVSLQAQRDFVIELGWPTLRDWAVAPVLPLSSLSPLPPLPPLLISAIVEMVAPHEQGEIIRTIRPAWTAVLAELVKDPDALLRLSPRQLEELVAASYEAEGYDQVVLTPRSGDFGIDVIAIKNGHHRVRVFDQVKRYRPGNVVSAMEVQALMQTVLAHREATRGTPVYGTTIGVVTTTSTFAPRIPSNPYLSPYLQRGELILLDHASMSGRLLKLRNAVR
jgi:restriction system protein